MKSNALNWCIHSLKWFWNFGYRRITKVKTCHIFRWTTTRRSNVMSSKSRVSKLRERNSELHEREQRNGTKQKWRTRGSWNYNVFIYNIATKTVGRSRWIKSVRMNKWQGDRSRGFIQSSNKAYGCIICIIHNIALLIL